MNLTDNEIIKALECCAEPKQQGCSHCLIADRCISGEINICACVLDLINCKDVAIEVLKKDIDYQKAEIERLHEIINGFEEQSHKDLLQFVELSEKYGDAQAEIEKYQQIEQTVKDFWSELKKMSAFKDLQEPTLTELLEYIEQTNAEAIKEFSGKVHDIFMRYAHLHILAEDARGDNVEALDGTKLEMQSVWDAFILQKNEMAEYEEMGRLQENIETIAKERLLAELEKDFRLLVKEMENNNG